MMAAQREYSCSSPTVKASVAPKIQTVDEFSATSLTAALWCGASGQAPLTDPQVLAVHGGLPHQCFHLPACLLKSQQTLGGSKQAVTSDHTVKSTGQSGAGLTTDHF